MRHSKPGSLIPSLLSLVGMISLGLYSCKSDEFAWRQAEVAVRIGTGPALPLSDQPMEVQELIRRHLAQPSRLDSAARLEMALLNAPGVLYEEPDADVLLAIRLAQETLAADYKPIDMKAGGERPLEWGWKITLGREFGSDRFRLSCVLSLLDRDGFQMTTAPSLSISEPGEVAQTTWRTRAYDENRISNSKGSASCELRW